MPFSTLQNHFSKQIEFLSHAIFRKSLFKFVLFTILLQKLLSKGFVARNLVTNMREIIRYETKKQGRSQDFWRGMPNFLILKNLL